MGPCLRGGGHPESLCSLTCLGRHDASFYAASPAPGTSPTLPQPAPSRARTLEAGKRWARLTRTKFVILNLLCQLTRWGKVSAKVGTVMGEQPQGLLLTCPSTSKDPSEETDITSLERETKVGSGERQNSCFL